MHFCSKFHIPDKQLNLKTLHGLKDNNLIQILMDLCPICHD